MRAAACADRAELAQLQCSLSVRQLGRMADAKLLCLPAALLCCRLGADRAELVHLQDSQTEL